MLLNLYHSTKLSAGDASVSSRDSEELREWGGGRDEGVNGHYIGLDVQ